MPIPRGEYTRLGCMKYMYCMCDVNIFLLQSTLPIKWMFQLSMSHMYLWWSSAICHIFKSFCEVNLLKSMQSARSGQEKPLTKHRLLTDLSHASCHMLPVLLFVYMHFAVHTHISVANICHKTYASLNHDKQAEYRPNCCLNLSVNEVLSRKRFN